MRISDVVGITGVRLLNQPSISAINHLCFSLEKLTRGDLFIAKNIKDIKQAVKKGAFGILFEGDIVPTDDEIAWLQADSLNIACASFVRYLLVELGMKVIVLNPIELEIAQSILDKQRALFTTQGTIDFLEQIHVYFEESCHGSIEQTKDLPYVFATQDFLNSLNLDPYTVLCFVTPQLKLISQSLLQMKVALKEQSYTLPLPGFFFNLLYDLIKLLQTLEVDFDLKQMRPLQGLKIYYFDSEGYLSQAQESNKIVVMVEDFQLFKKFSSFLEKNIKWAKKYYFLPQESEKFSSKGKVHYRDHEDIIKKLCQKSYHLALVYGNSQDQYSMIVPLIKKETQWILL